MICGSAEFRCVGCEHPIAFGYELDIIMSVAPRWTCSECGCRNEAVRVWLVEGEPSLNSPLPEPSPLVPLRLGSHGLADETSERRCAAGEHDWVLITNDAGTYTVGYCERCGRQEP